MVPRLRLRIQVGPTNRNEERMSDAGDVSAEAIEAELRRYLLAHPGAADTAEGIRRWWLPERFAGEPAHRVEEALGRLVSRGVLVRVGLPDGQTLYVPPERGPEGPPNAA